MASCLGDRKQVQNTQFDSHLTGIKKNVFCWLTKTLYHMTRAFRESGNKCAMLKKVYSVKTNTTVSFSSRMNGWSILEAGQCVCCVCFEVASIFPSMVSVKKHCGYQKSLSRSVCCHCRRIRSLIFFGKTSRIASSPFSSF